jgi:hypothetical protein
LAATWRFELTTLYPRLQQNALLHVHDIFSPFDYPRDWMVKEKRFWNEQYALECFLMFNSAFESLPPFTFFLSATHKILPRLSADFDWTRNSSTQG